MGRPRKIKSARALAAAWEEFKVECDTYEVPYREETTLTNADGVSHAEVEKRRLSPVSYTIVGFCVFIGISKSTWYSTYENDPKYSDIVRRIHSECEADVRRKFETGVINSRLAPLWMSKFGYGAKVETTQEHKADNNLMDAIRDSLNALGEGDEDGA